MWEVKVWQHPAVRGGHEEGDRGMVGQVLL